MLQHHNWKAHFSMGIRYSEHAPGAVHHFIPGGAYLIKETLSDY